MCFGRGGECIGDEMKGDRFRRVVGCSGASVGERARI